MARVLREQAVVEKVEGDLAYVLTRSQLACKGCQTLDSCGNGLLEQYFGQKQFVTPVKNSINARPGQKVLVEAPAASVTRASLTVYWLPLLIMLSAAMTAQEMNMTEGVVVLSGLSGLFAGFALVRWLLRRRSGELIFEPKLRALLNTEPDSEPRP